jgi:hypothetical protein
MKYCFIKEKLRHEYGIYESQKVAPSRIHLYAYRYGSWKDQTYLSRCHKLLSSPLFVHVVKKAQSINRRFVEFGMSKRIVTCRCLDWHREEWSYKLGRDDEEGSVCTWAWQAGYLIGKTTLFKGYLLFIWSRFTLHLDSFQLPYSDLLKDPYWNWIHTYVVVMKWTRYNNLTVYKNRNE